MKKKIYIAPSISCIDVPELMQSDAWHTEGPSGNDVNAHGSIGDGTDIGTTTEGDESDDPAAKKFGDFKPWQDW